MLAKIMCLDSSKIKKIKIGVLFHDLGKVLIDKEVLNKPSRLTLEEFDLIKEHSKLGLKILKNKHGDEVIKSSILFHHEKWNGEGYPLGLSKENIPIEARIISIVDCYDALTCKRVYKDEISHEKVVEILKNEAGKSFDPAIIFVFDLFNKKFEELLKENRCSPT